jgi:hypothetical protein
MLDMRIGWPTTLMLVLALGCSGGVDLAGDGQDSPDGTVGDTATDETATDAAVDEAVEAAEDDAGAADDAATDEGGAACAPMDARAEGDCEMVLPGFAWNGAHCVPLGSGCGCAGADCGAVYDTVAACVDDRRACFGTAVCGSQAAASGMCVVCGVPMYLGAFWNGRSCFEVVGCECVGDDCAGAYASLEECVAVHEGCDGPLCAATGGEGFPAAAGTCGFVCGAVAPEDCLTPFDACRCPPGNSFVAGTGCAPDPACDAEVLCAATRGTWHPSSECICGFSCGNPGACGACLDSCDCGPHRNFDGTIGCRADVACGSEWERPEVCTSTGGEWHACGTGGDCSCGDYHCGVPNLMDPCVMPGCDCGPYANFDSAEGCVWDDTCALRELDQECTGRGLDGSTCRPGLACCSGGGAALYPSTCGNPCCADDVASCMPDGCPPPAP